jgi:membrane protein implicated in regulation of membrane protease activity
MSYTVEWMGGVVVFGIVLLLLIVPEFAVIAVVVATSAVLVVALAALVGLVALAAAVLVSPYLLVRSVRRRRGQRRTRLIHAPSGIPSRSAVGVLIEDAARDAA